MKTVTEKEMSAWDRASSEGCDVSLLEENLRLSPAERVISHRRALRTALILRRAVEARYAGGHGSSARPTG